MSNHLIGIGTDHLRKLNLTTSPEQVLIGYREVHGVYAFCCACFVKVWEMAKEMLYLQLRLEASGNTEDKGLGEKEKNRS